MTRLLALAALLGLLGAAPAVAQPGRVGALPRVVGVEIASPHRLPDARVHALVEPLVGRPRGRAAVRESLERLWALGILSTVRVEEREADGGVRLVYHLERRPHVRDVEVRGDLGVAEVDVIDAIGLGRGDPVDAARLARARDAVLALCRREGFFAARLSVDQRIDETTNGRDLIVTLDGGARARVGSVEIRDGGRAAELVRPLLRPRKGRAYRDADLRESVERAQRRLRDEGFFAARLRPRPPAWDAVTNRVALVVDLDAGPEVRVQFDGGRALGERELRERLTFAQPGAVDEAEVAASARQLEAAYHERGYPFVSVHGALQHQEGEALVRFTIEEGPRVTVESVTFTGDFSLPAARLAAQMQTRPRGFLGGGVFDRAALERDVRAVQALLQASGFPDARVGPAQVTFSEDRSRARVVVPVAEGPAVRVGALTISGAALFTTEELRAQVPLSPGGPWNQARAEQGRRAIERRYARRGYHAAEVRLEVSRRDGVVDVAYHVVEGIQTRVGRILVRGLTRTRESVVRREIQLAEGAPLNPEALLDAQRRLAALGLFERIHVEPLRPPPVPFADVVITVREGKPWYLDFGGGYGSFEGLRGFVEAGHDNLFGTGRNLALRLRASERGDREEIIYRHPWLLGWDVRGDASLFHEGRAEIGYDLERFGVTVGVQRDLRAWLAGLRGTLRYQFSRVERFNVDAMLAREEVVRGTERVATMTPALILDRRDHPLDPRRGSFHLVSLTAGGHALGGDADFIKSQLETTWLLDALPPTVLALSARVGLAAPLLGTPSLPAEERFYAGGSTTVRGYRERRLGPVDTRGNPLGGNARLIFNAELRFPIWRWLTGAVFFDSGAVTAEIEDLAPNELKSGVGAGLRVTTPVGPVRLDVGYPLDRVPHQDQKLRVYVTVGYPF